MYRKALLYAGEVIGTCSDYFITKDFVLIARNVSLVSSLLGELKSILKDEEYSVQIAILTGHIFILSKNEMFYRHINELKG